MINLISIRHTHNILLLIILWPFIIRKKLKYYILSENHGNSFETLTDEQVLGHIYNGWSDASYPMNSINAMVQNITPKHIDKQTDFFYVRFC